jgi:hypothetical protein
VFTHVLRTDYSEFMRVYAEFTQGSLMFSLCIVYASLRMVYARFTHGLRKVYAEFTQMFTQGLRKVYAEFTQSLRRLCRVYAMFTQVYAVLVHAVSCVNLARDFTGLRKVYAGLRI